LEQNGRLVQRHVGSTAIGIVRQEPGGDHPGADDCTHSGSHVDTCVDRYAGSDSHADSDTVADRDTTDPNADRYRAGCPV